MEVRGVWGERGGGGWGEEVAWDAENLIASRLVPCMHVVQEKPCCPSTSSRLLIGCRSGLTHHEASSAFCILEREHAERRGGGGGGLVQRTQHPGRVLQRDNPLPHSLFIPMVTRLHLTTTNWPLQEACAGE